MPQALKRLDGHSIDVNRPEAAAGRTAVNQPSIAAAFQTVSAKANEAELKAALVYCMNPAVPFRLAGDGYFLQAYGKPISRLKIPKVVATFAVDLKSRVKEALKRQIHARWSTRARLAGTPKSLL